MEDRDYVRSFIDASDIMVSIDLEDAFLQIFFIKFMIIHINKSFKTFLNVFLKIENVRKVLE